MQDVYNRKRNEKRRARRLSDRQSTADAETTTTVGEGRMEEGTEGEAAAVEGDGDGDGDDHALDLEAWLHATGGPKKGRLIGFGPRVDARSILDSSATAADAWESQYCGTSSQADTRIEDLARQLEQERRLRQEQAETFQAMQQQQQQREEQRQQREEQTARAMQEQARVLEAVLQQVAELQRSRDPPPGDSSTAPHSPPSPS